MKAVKASKKQDWPLAGKRWRKVLDILGDEVPPEVYLGLGRALYKQEKFDLAGRVLRRGRQHNRDHLALETEYARLAMFQKNWAEAVGRWKTVAGLYEGVAPPRVFLGLVKSLKKQYKENRCEDDLHAAEELLGTACDNYPRSFQLAVERARISDLRGDWITSVERWTRAQQIAAGNDESIAVRGSWYPLYVSGDHGKALESVYRYLSANNARQTNETELARVAKVLKRFDHPKANYDFVSGVVENGSLREHQMIAIAAMSWMLAIPSVIAGLLPQLEKASIGGYLWRRLEAMCPGQPGTGKVIVVLEHATDVRIVYDLARVAKQMVVLTLPKMVGKVHVALDHIEEFEVFEIGSNLPVNSQYEVAIAGDAETIATDVIRKAAELFKESHLGKMIKDYAPALCISLDDLIYRRAVMTYSCALFAAQFNPDHVYIVCAGSENADYLWRPLSTVCERALLSSIHAPLDHAIEAVSGTCTAVEPPSGVILKDTLENLSRFFLKHRYPLFGMEEPMVGIIGNFNPNDFKVRGIAVPVLGAVLKRHNCMIIQPNAIKPGKVQEIKDFLASSGLDDQPGKYFFWAGMDHVIEGANDFSRDWRDVVYASLADALSRTSWMKMPGIRMDLLGYSFVCRAVYDFLQKDFWSCLYLAACVEDTFEENRMTGLLMIAHDRSMSGRIFTRAAQNKKIPTFAYSFLFHTANPRYKRPIVDYVILPDTSFASFFEQHFGLRKDQLLLAGSHMVLNRISKAAQINPVHCKDGRNSLREYIIVFATQSKIVDFCMNALRGLIDACKTISVQIIIKLHPGDIRHADDYTLLVAKSGADKWAFVDLEDNLTEVILASDLVVTLFSNVGVEAAALDRHVLSIQFEEEAFPIDLAEIGVAVSAKSGMELKKMLPELLGGGPAARLCKERRDSFFAKNPQLLCGSVEERIARYVSAGHEAYKFSIA